MLAADTGAIAEVGREDLAEAMVQHPHERPALAGPLAAAELPQGSPRALYAALIIALFVLAGLTHLTGAPPFLTVAIAVVGIVGLVVMARTLRLEDRAAALIDAN